MQICLLMIMTLVSCCYMPLNAASGEWTPQEIKEFTEIILSDNTQAVVEYAQSHDLSTFSGHPLTFLVNLIKNDKIEMMRLLLDYHVPWDRQNIELALTNTREYSSDMVRLIVEKHPQFPKEILQAELSWAVHEKNLKKVQALVDAGVALHQIDISFWNLTDDDVELRDYLISNGLKDQWEKNQKEKRQMLEEIEQAKSKMQQSMQKLHDTLIPLGSTEKLEELQRTAQKLEKTLAEMKNESNNKSNKQSDSILTSFTSENIEKTVARYEEMRFYVSCVVLGIAVVYGMVYYLWLKPKQKQDKSTILKKQSS